MVKQQGITVQLPGAATAVKDLPVDPDATLTVAADGAFFWNREALPPDMIRSRLATLARQKPDARLIINGDKDARLGAALELLDAVRAAGLTRVNFQTQPAASSHSAPC